MEVIDVSIDVSTYSEIYNNYYSSLSEEQKIECAKQTHGIAFSNLKRAGILEFIV